MIKKMYTNHGGHGFWSGEFTEGYREIYAVVVVA